MAKKRTVLMVPFGAVAAVLCFTSAAWACGVLVGSITITGSRSGAPTVTMTGTGSGHFAGGDSGPTWSCLVNEGSATDPCPNDNGPDIPVAEGEDPHAWVDISTAQVSSTNTLPDSTGSYSYCTGGSPPVPDTGQLGRCALGSLNVPPPLGVQNDVGDYWVNLVQAQWVNADPRDSDFDGGTGAASPITGNPVKDGDRVSGKISSGCGNGADQSARVVHIGLATISSGAISAASTPPADTNRAFVDDPTVPAPRSLGSGVWRFYLPTTNLAPTTPTDLQDPPDNVPPLVANSVCVVDRYGTKSIEAPIQLFTI